MRNWSISAGRIFGVELRIHWTFFLLPLFVWYTEYASHGTANEARDLALVGIIFASVLAHEFGHALVARRTGMRAKSIIPCSSKNPEFGDMVYLPISRTRFSKPFTSSVNLRLSRMSPKASPFTFIVAGANGNTSL